MKRTGLVSAHLLLALLLLDVPAQGSYSMDDLDFGDDDMDGLDTSMLQVSMQLTPSANLTGHRDLVMAHMPYSIGHTVTKKAYPAGIEWGDCGDKTGSSVSCTGFATSSSTGCQLMHTPAKHWPTELAQQHFGGRTVFGILQDPYERLVAQFRGSGASEFPELHARCDVNEAVKRQMRMYIAATERGDPYAEQCKLLPQADFFDGPYGATVAVDSRRFPHSMNELLAQHGYPDLIIKTEEVDPVRGCDHVWAGDLDSEAKTLVRQVYHRDFELLCSRFGHCDTSENTCLTRVRGMCPPQLFEWDAEGQAYSRRS